MQGTLIWGRLEADIARGFNDQREAGIDSPSGIDERP
jgi:hypothetical protein